MHIADKTAVWLEYTLRDDDGDLIDASEPGEPLVYIHGQGDLVPGLEKELVGKSIGDKFKVSVPPAEGYGLRSDSKLQSVPRSAFEEDAELAVGMQFQTDDPEGEIVTVVNVAADEVTIDANHPLAGKALHFEIAVLDVRQATAEELEHGHVHDGSHAHHH